MMNIYNYVFTDDLESNAWAISHNSEVRKDALVWAFTAMMRPNGYTEEEIDKAAEEAVNVGLKNTHEVAVYCAPNNWGDVSYWGVYYNALTGDVWEEQW